MQNLIILGAGVAGLTLARRVKGKNKNCNIRLIDKNEYYICREKIIDNPADISSKINIAEAAQNLGIGFINDFVDKISPRRKKLYLKQSESLDFDNLVIASGLISKKKDIKGEHRDGFLYLSDIGPFKLKDLLKISSEVCIDVSTWLGVRLALAIKKLDKEVRVIVSDLDFLGQDKERVISALKQKEIIFHFDSKIEEAVGESVVKAIKISPLKVFSSQILIVDSGFEPNFKFFEEGINIKNNFCTDYEGIYLIGETALESIGINKFFLSNIDDINRQLDSFVKFITEGEEIDFSPKGLEEDIQISINKICKEGELWQSGSA